MSNPILAPIQLDKLYITDSYFHIESDPASKMDIKLDVSCETIQEQIRDEVGELEIRLNVISQLVDADNDKNVKLTAKASVQAKASSPLPQNMDTKDKKRYLYSNTIGLAYSHAKSYILEMTALSPMGAMILPAILPGEMVSQIKFSD